MSILGFCVEQIVLSWMALIGRGLIEPGFGQRPITVLVDARSGYINRAIWAYIVHSKSVQLSHCRRCAGFDWSRGESGFFLFFQKNAWGDSSSIWHPSYYFPDTFKLRRDVLPTLGNVVDDSEPVPCQHTVPDFRGPRTELRTRNDTGEGSYAEEQEQSYTPEFQEAEGHGC